MPERIYSDLESAGRELAVALAKNRKSNSLLLAIANGGVPVAIPIADYLETALDILVIRRLFMREERPLPVCAVSVGGNMVVDSDLRTLSSIEDQFRQDAIEDLSKRADRMRCNMRSRDVAGLNVVLVDNGIHTGSTIQIAINALRQFRPRSVTLTVPVADASIKHTVEALADEVVCLQWCERFGNAALWYKNFNRPGDDEIRRIIQTRAPINYTD